MAPAAGNMWLFEESVATVEDAFTSGHTSRNFRHMEVRPISNLYWTPTLAALGAGVAVEAVAKPWARGKRQGGLIRCGFEKLRARTDASFDRHSGSKSSSRRSEAAC